MESKKEAQDMVNHPSHYAGQGKVECIDYIAVAVGGYVGEIAGDLQNVVKYTWRTHHKNGKEDLEKALWYATRATQKLQEIKTDRPALFSKMKDMVQFVTEHRTEKEKEVFNEGMLQVWKPLNSLERSCYKGIIDSIRDGSFIMDERASKVICQQLGTWVERYDKTVSLKRPASENLKNNGLEVSR